LIEVSGQVYVSAAPFSGREYLSRTG